MTVHTCVECGKRIQVGLVRGADGKVRHLDCHLEREQEGGGDDAA